MIRTCFLMIPALFAFLTSLPLVGGTEPVSLLTATGKELLREEFSFPEIPATFRTLKTPEAFRIVDGALQLGWRPGQTDATHGAFPCVGHDMTIAFSVKFASPGTLYVGVDGYKEAFQGNTHLVRFALAPDHMAWDEKQGGPESKRAVSEANRAARAAKQPLPEATAEQLADPTYFRTMALAERPIECKVGEWHRVLLEINGNELVAQVDAQVLAATATVADAKKNRIGVGLTGRSTALVDDVRIWENTRRPDWQQVKARLATPAAMK